MIESNINMTRQLPLVVVLGATACGKSKLAIDLARRFGGEIISADSMQVYRGLDIVTNKVGDQERTLAKHHMIDFLDPSQRFSVVDFRDKSLNIIENLFAKAKLPIVVGGTNYYIESLLWKSFIMGNRKDQDNQESDNNSSEESIAEKSSPTLIDKEFESLKAMPKNSLHTEEDFESLEKFFSKPIYNDAFAKVSSEKLWRILELVDPTAAHLYHHNDKRRLIRCLQIIQEKGQNYTNILKEANVKRDSSSEGTNSETKPMLGGSLRFNPTCIFWLDCDNQALLDSILDKRVDEMLNRGLLAELENFHEDYNKKRLLDNQGPPTYSSGIFQSIGFKEFHDYLTLDPKVKDSEKGNKILRSSIEMMKISTKRYSKYQVKWIVRRFLHFGTRDLPPIFKLNIPDHYDQDLEFKWIEQVRDPAFEIVESIMSDKDLSLNVLKFKQEPFEQAVVRNPGKFYCQPCDRTFIGSNQIQDHLDSKTHRRRVEAYKRKQKREEERQLPVQK